MVPFLNGYMEQTYLIQNGWYNLNCTNYYYPSITFTFLSLLLNYELGCKLACDKRQAENTADRWPGTTYQHCSYESVTLKTATFTMMFIKVCHYACNITASAFS